jgi:hypothetical protein
MTLNLNYTRISHGVQLEIQERISESVRQRAADSLYASHPLC